MAINIDESPNEDIWDPYVQKSQAASQRKIDFLRQFYRRGLNSGGDVRDTSMVYLVLQSGLVFEDDYYMRILGLNPHIAAHLALYRLLSREVRLVAGILRRNIMAHSMLQMPMSDIRSLCYRIADRYESLFYVPVKTPDEEKLCAISFLWKDRYNGMWPIVSMLHREYQETSM
ncbi:CIC11C00000003115 [Sungouiella intermedia]|uniref:CIC11C00000003115 n=1 Tax=Sungouiella intermedia TaxID=45354 RepID=A0A1L0DK95_9ASCO|nr:CIC11C00000003115 [[Candida] intermedia]